MPYFHKPHNEFVMDISNYMPVSVVANFSKSGAFIPEYFCVEIQNKLFKYKILSLKYERDYPGYKQFCCNYKNNNRLFEVLLLYHFKSHKWYCF